LAYDEDLAQRVRDALAEQDTVTEKKMFGGLSFLVNGNMCCGVAGEDLMLRVGAERYDEALSRPHARPMDFTGKPLTGFVFVAPKGVTSDKGLNDWVGLAVAFAGSLSAK
jgi:TfoX/Sxy family transcriptional regulator of competence genes